MKEKGPLQGHSRSSKGKSSDALPQETLNREQKQNTQSATAGSKNKTKQKLQHAILKPKSTLWKEVMVWTALAFASVWVFPHPGTLYRSHSPLLLEKSHSYLALHTAPLPGWPKFFKLRDFLSHSPFSDSPQLPNSRVSTQTCTTLLAKTKSPQLSTPCSLHLCLRTMWIKYIHEGKKIKHTFKFSFFPLLLMT